MLSEILYVAAALVVGAVVALKLIAPKTATKVDDEALADLEKVEPYAEKVVAAGAPVAPAKA